MLGLSRLIDALKNIFGHRPNPYGSPNLAVLVYLTLEMRLFINFIRLLAVIVETEKLERMRFFL